jgi:two-component system, LytTR family, response regulator
MDKIRVIIVDDEAPARELIRHYLSGIPEAEIAGECEDGFQALKAIQEYEPDLVFLDIQMPKITGFELLEVLDKKPCIIFTTAYDQFAIKAFEMNAVDYLLKPFSKERFKLAFEKAKQRVTSPSGAIANIDSLKARLDEEKQTLERIVTRLGSKLSVIPVDKIWYLEAQDDYVMIYSDLGNHLKENTMKYFMEHLPDDLFIQIHRSYIVNISHIASIELYEKNTHLVTMKGGSKLRASAEGYKRLREVMR